MMGVIFVNHLDDGCHHYRHAYLSFEMRGSEEEHRHEEA